MEYFVLRTATIHDIDAIYDLYSIVSKEIGGLARSSDEITIEYVRKFTSKSQTNGLQYIIEDIRNSAIIGEIHGYKLEPKVFSHILSEITIAIHPNFQGLGHGKKLFQHFLEYVHAQRTDILRIELIARESNRKAIEFYQKLGFQIEGKFINRIKGISGFEADIPMAWINENYLYNDEFS